MKISSKGRYAVRIMTEIARNTDKCVSVSDIASSQNLSIKYTEQIINKLVKNKLLESFRGSLGGYKLCKPAQEYTIYQILKTTNDVPDLAPCMQKSCPRRSSCDTVGCWETLNSLIFDYLNHITLQDILDKNYKN